MSVNAAVNVATNVVKEGQDVVKEGGGDDGDDDVSVCDSVVPVVVVLAPMVRGSEKAFRMLLRSYHHHGYHHRHRHRHRHLHHHENKAKAKNKVVVKCYSPMLRSEYVLKGYEIWKQRRQQQQQQQQQRTNEKHEKEEEEHDDILNSSSSSSSNNDNKNDNCQQEEQNQGTTTTRIKNNSDSSSSSSSRKRQKRQPQQQRDHSSSLHEDTILFLEDLEGASSRNDDGSSSSIGDEDYCDDGDHGDDDYDHDDEDIENLVVQICGNDPIVLYQATTAILERTDGKISGIDLNLGCPQSCAKDGNFGAYLVENSSQRAIECLKAMVRARNDYVHSNGHSDCCCCCYSCCNYDRSDNTTTNDDKTNHTNSKRTTTTRKRRRIPTISTKIRLALDLQKTIQFIHDIRRINTSSSPNNNDNNGGGCGYSCCGCGRLGGGGVDYVTVHCRHRHVKFNGDADLEHAGRTILQTFSTTTTQVSSSSSSRNVHNNNDDHHNNNENDDGDDGQRNCNNSSSVQQRPFIWINGADICSYDDIWKTYRQLGVDLPENSSISCSSATTTITTTTTTKASKATTGGTTNVDDESFHRDLGFRSGNELSSFAAASLPKLMIARNWLARPDLLSSKRLDDGTTRHDETTISTTFKEDATIESSTKKVRRRRTTTTMMMIPAILASQYLTYAKRFLPPNEKYVQTHFRWFFRSVLAPQPFGSDPDYKNNWRHRFWSFLHRPYLRHIEQFELIVVLYCSMAGLTKDQIPPPLQHLDIPSFSTIRHYGDMDYKSEEERI